MDNEIEMLNPQIKEIVIGVKILKTIKIYPLSAADQLELTGNISEAILNVVSLQHESNAKIISIIRTIVADNIGQILKYVTDEGEPLLKDITNSQILDLVEAIYDTNYGSLEKKTAGLLKKLVKTFLPARLSQVSSETTLNTDSKTSSEEVSETEVLQ